MAILPPSGQSPRERYLACMRGEPMDRVPLVLEGLAYPTHKAAAEEPDALRREVALRIFQETHFAHGVPSYLNRYLVTPPQFIRRVSSHAENGNTIDTVKIDTPRGPYSAASRGNSSRTWITNGQWLQMNITSSPCCPSKSDSDTDWPVAASVRVKSGAFVPSGTMVDGVAAKVGSS